MRSAARAERAPKKILRVVEGEMRSIEFDSRAGTTRPTHRPISSGGAPHLPSGALRACFPAARSARALRQCYCIFRSSSRYQQ